MNRSPYTTVGELGKYHDGSPCFFFGVQRVYFQERLCALSTRTFQCPDECLKQARPLLGEDPVDIGCLGFRGLG